MKRSSRGARWCCDVMGLSTIIIIVVVLAGFAGWWLHVCDQRRRRRQIEVLGALACPACGAAYGVAAAEQARRDWLARCEESRRRLPHCKINFDRDWGIRCTQCGAQAKFNTDSEALVMR